MEAWTPEDSTHKLHNSNICQSRFLSATLGGPKMCFLHFTQTVWTESQAQGQFICEIIDPFGGRRVTTSLN